MSSRNLRKVCGNNSLPVPDDDSDDDYQPLYAKQPASKFTYQGLELSSESEEHESMEFVSTEEEEPVPEPETSKKNNKKKNKKKKVKQAAKAADDEDEIDKSLKEINALMGAPAPVPASAVEDKQKQTLIPDVLLVQPKHLNVANELKKKFGADSSEERNKRGNRQVQLRIQKKSIIVPLMEHAGSFQKVGLSMSIWRRAEGYVWFTFDHGPEYQRRQQRLLIATATGRLPEPSIEEAQRHMHIEGMLETADMMFRMEEYSAANTLIERSIAYMQYIAHPSFQLADPATRLPYLYMENRTFHIAVLKYLHLLTNRACHRTALELAKMLLNLDPEDPLAILLIIDTLALRAREHQWLIDAVDHWANERDAGFLFSIQYSYAMAHFHVATKNKTSVDKADTLLQEAMLRFPSVLVRVLDCANAALSPRLQAHPLFTAPDDKITKNLQELILLYAKFTWSKWREPAVFEWLQRNANELADKYDNDGALQDRAKALTNEQLNLFRSWPDEVVRHLCVIKPMANLLVDGAVPHVTNLVSADPAPPAQGVNRYSYTFGPPPAPPGAHSALRDLFSSLLPNYAAHLPPDLELDVQEIERQNPALAMALAYAMHVPDDDSDGYEFIFGDIDGEPPIMYESIGALTRTVRRVMTMYGAGSQPSPGDPPRGDSPSEDPPSDDSPGFDPPRVDPPSDDPSRGDQSREEPPSDDPLRSNPPRDHQLRVDPPRDAPSRGNQPRDDPPSGDPPRSDPPSDDPPRSDPRRDDQSRVDPPRADPSRGDQPRDDPPAGDPPHSDPPCDDPLRVDNARDGKPRNKEDPVEDRGAPDEPDHDKP